MANILNIGVNDGHTISGPGSGAIGRIKESVVTREVGQEVRRLIKQRGHNSIDCTIDYAKTSNEALALIVQQANRQDLDWFVAIHFNAGGGRGVEVYTYRGRQFEDSINVCKNISALGFKNRGVKDGSGLYVVNKTKAKSMLIEVCFVDTEDADQYLKVGAKAVAKAIVNGILGEVANTNEDKKEILSKYYTEEFKKFYNQVTKTKAPIKENSIYDDEAKKAYEMLGKLMRGEY